MRELFPRYYEMRDKDGKVLLRASAIWLLMDEKSRRMVFPEAYGMEVPAPDIQPNIALPCGIALGEQKQEKTFTVSYSQVDINGHMNNSKYIDETEDLLGAEYLKDHELRALEIEYKSEVKLGRRVTLKYTQSGDDLSLVGVVEGNPCFELVAKFAPIRR